MSVEFLLLLGVMVCVVPPLCVLVLGIVSRNILILATVAVLGRFLANGLNQWMGLFEPKLAGDMAIKLYVAVQDGMSIPYGDTFLVQMLLAWPFLAVDASLASLILANNVWSIVLTFWAVALIKKNLDRKSLLMLLAVGLFFPIVINFSLFGSRDPIIYGFVFLFIAASLRFAVKPALGGALVWLFAFAAIALLRPELCVPLLAFPVLQAFGLSAKVRLGRGLEASNIAAQRIMIYVLLGFVTAIGALGVYRLGLTGIGYSETAAPSEVVEQYVTARHQRQFRDAGGSAIYSQDDFSSLPIPVRAAVSFSAMLLIPFPWYVTDLPRLLTFVDSLLTIWLLIWCLTGARRRHGSTKESRNLMIAFLLSTFVIGLFMVNFGNAFRMRLAIMPLLFLAAAFIYTELRSRRCRER